MGIYDKDGARITKAAFPATNVPAGDVPKLVTKDIYTTKKSALGDGRPEGSIRTLLCKANTVMTQKQIDALFADATIDSVSPANGAVAGGTVVTIKGTNLDGATGVTFGGTAGTNFKVISDTELRVTTPAKAAGAVAVAVADDSGTVTKANGFTFA